MKCLKVDQTGRLLKFYFTFITIMDLEMLKDTSTRHCQSLHIGVANTEVLVTFVKEMN